jgi:hypothetical protein
VDGEGRATVFAALPAGRYRVDADFTPADPALLTGSRVSSEHMGTVPGDSDHHVGKAATVVGAAPDRVVAGAKATLTARVTVDPGSAVGVQVAGRVQFSVDGVDVGDPVSVVDGQARADTRLDAGDRRIAARYVGDPNLAVSASDPRVWTVGKSTPAVTVRLAGTDSTAGGGLVADVSVTPTGGVAHVPTGSVTLVDHSTGRVVATSLVLDAQGAARVALGLGRGEHRLSGAYSGDGSFLPASSPVVATSLPGREVVVEAGVSVSPARHGESLLVSAHVRAAGSADLPRPGGRVQFTLDGLPYGVDVPLESDGSAAAGWEGLTVGDHQVRARYLGDGVFDPGVSVPVVFTVLAARQVPSVSLALSDQRVSASGRVVATALVSAPAGVPWVPTGNVEILDLAAGEVVAGPVPLDTGGGATLAVALPRGDHRLTAAYLGDDRFTEASSAVAGTASVGQTVVVAASLSASPVVQGGRVTLAAQVTSTEASSGLSPGGQVQFEIDGVATGPPVDVAQGRAQTEASAAIVGEHRVRATYLGDPVFDPATSQDVTLQVIAPAPVQPVSLTVSTKLDKTRTHVVVTTTATPLVGGYSPAGRLVTVHVNGEKVKTVRTDGTGKAVAVVRTNLLKVGKNPIVVRFAPGSAEYSPTVSRTLSHTLRKPTPAKVAVKVTIDKNNGRATVAATVKSAITGHRVANRTVEILLNGKKVGTVKTDARGRAVYTIPPGKLVRGDNPVVARYRPGTVKYRVATSSTVVIRANRSGWAQEAVK